MLKQVLYIVPFIYIFSSNAQQYSAPYYANQYASQKPYRGNQYTPSQYVPQSNISSASVNHSGPFISIYSGFDFSAKIQSTIGDAVYDDSYKVSPIAGGAIGYEYRDTSLYFSYDHRSFKSKDNDPVYGNKLNIDIALVNIAYNFNASPSFIPYVSLGVGMAMSQIKYNGEVTYIDNSKGTKQDIDNAFTYQVKGGASLFLTQHVAVFADARFTSIQSSNYTKNQFFDEGSTVQMQFFSLNGGVSYFF